MKGRKCTRRILLVLNTEHRLWPYLPSCRAKPKLANATGPVADVSRSKTTCNASESYISQAGKPREVQELAVALNRASATFWSVMVLSSGRAAILGNVFAAFTASGHSWETGCHIWMNLVETQALPAMAKTRKCACDESVIYSCWKG